MSSNTSYIPLVTLPIPGSEAAADSNPIYRPLNAATKEIRLICILPKNDDRDQVRIAMTHACLIYKPFYAALSYTWGAENPAYEIEVLDPDGVFGRFSVRQNLYDFLTTIRTPNYFGTWFWIDQICINQDDPIERSQQVSQMADLYAQSMCTTIWLGPSFDGSDEFMDFMAQSNVDFESLVKAMGSSPNQLDESSRLIWDTYNAACLRFAELPYWSRVWIVQEILLSFQRIVHLGSKTVPWMLMKRCLPFFQHASYASYSFSPLNVSRPSFNRCSDIVRLDRPGVNHLRLEYEHTWQSVIMLVYFKQCTDPRDKAYGLMGLLREQLRMYPDYLESSNPATIILEIVRKEVDDNLHTLRMKITTESNHAKASELVRSHLHFAYHTVLTMFMWCDLFYEDEKSSYNAQMMRRCLRQEIFDRFREQRASLGGHRSHHNILDAIIAHILFPNIGGLNDLRLHFYQFFRFCNNGSEIFDYLRDVIKEKTVKLLRK